MVARGLPPGQKISAYVNFTPGGPDRLGNEDKMNWASDVKEGATLLIFTDYYILMKSIIFCLVYQFFGTSGQIRLC